MKSRFERLSKKEQKEAIREFKEASTKNANVINRLHRLKVIGILGTIYSLIMFILDFLKEADILDYGFNTFGDAIILNYLIDASLMVFCVFFIFKSEQMIKEQVNKYLVDKLRNKQKKAFKEEFGEN